MTTRALVAGLMVVLTVGVLGLGVLLSNSHGASEVAGNARRLHQVNAVLGAAGIARASVAQAVFFSFEDVSSAEGKRAALDEASRNIEIVATLSAEPEAPSDVDGLEEFVEASRAALELAEAGEPGDAEAIRFNEVEPAFSVLDEDLTETQDALAAVIAESEEVGGRIARITFVAISFAIPAVTMVVFWILLRRRVRRREEAMQARLVAEQELGRAKDEFIAGLSHELRTPLTTIVGFSQLLVEDDRIQGDVREHLGLIHASSADLARMVGDLLVAARLEADALTVSPEVVNLSAEVEAVTLPYLLSGEDVSVRVPALDVYCDALHLRQIVNNLVSNALRHGGDRVLVTATERRGSAELVVADNGPGVPDDLEPRLFTRFVHEGRQALLAGSVGLGLAVSKELAQRMGAALQYARTADWTTFTLKVPLLPGQPDDAPALSVVGVSE